MTPFTVFIPKEEAVEINVAKIHDHGAALGAFLEERLVDVSAIAKASISCGVPRGQRGKGWSGGVNFCAGWGALCSTIRTTTMLSA